MKRPTKARKGWASPTFLALAVFLTAALFLAIGAWTASNETNLSEKIIDLGLGCSAAVILFVLIDEGRKAYASRIR